MEQTCKCVICRNYDLEYDRADTYDMCSLFNESGKEVSIKLCKVHSIELFKSGQKNFLLNHYKILVDLIDSNDNAFLEVLEETVKKNINSIY